MSVSSDKMSDTEVYLYDNDKVIFKLAVMIVGSPQIIFKISPGKPTFTEKQDEW